MKASKEERFSHRHTCADSVIIWGGISYFGIVDLVIIEGKQDAGKYLSILENTVYNARMVF